MKHGITATTAGDLGDVFSGVLGVLSSIPGKHTLLLKDTVAGEHRTKGIVARAKLVIPLAQIQPYIYECCVWQEGDDKPDWHSCDFRKGFHSGNANLLDAHMGHALSVGITGTRFKGETAWLSCDRDPRAAGRVVINRSPRYNNLLFRWDEVVRHYGRRLLFVGLPQEHHAFESVFGPVERVEARDFLEVARLIRGSELFIGNQSACLSVAEGLKHPRIAECCLSPADTVYPGSTGAQYVFDGTMTLPGFDGLPDLDVPSSTLRTISMNVREVPPGCWQYRQDTQAKKADLVHSTALHLACDVSRHYGIDKELALSEVYRQNFERCPNHFARQINTGQFSTASLALQNAGITGHPVQLLMQGKITQSAFTTNP